MKKMQSLKPQIDKLREQYKNNPQMLNMKTMELYKKEGANPLSGCTDGDIRRAVQHHENIKTLTAADIMTHSFKHIHQEAMISQALELMDINNITSLAVTDTPDSNNIIGILHIHDIIDFK